MCNFRRSSLLYIFINSLIFLVLEILTYLSLSYRLHPLLYYKIFNLHILTSNNVKILNVFDWSGSNPMPPEYWMLPTWLPIHPSNMMCYTRITYMPMSYLYGKRFQAPLTSFVLQLRDELHTQPYHQINWKKARHMCAMEDLYFPHPIVQDLLWDTLYLLSEPLMTRWPFNKLIRQRALNETMRHIHYEDENSRYITIGCVEKVSYLNS
ncbi:hypothetical protein IC582_011703 [Cucumis melo]